MVLVGTGILPWLDLESSSKVSRESFFSFVVLRHRLFFFIEFTRSPGLPHCMCMRSCMSVLTAGPR